MFEVTLNFESCKIQGFPSEYLKSYPLTYTDQVDFIKQFKDLDVYCFVKPTYVYMATTRDLVKELDSILKTYDIVEEKIFLSYYVKDYGFNPDSFNLTEYLIQSSQLLLSIEKDLRRKEKARIDRINYLKDRNNKAKEKFLANKIVSEKIHKH